MRRRKVNQAVLDWIGVSLMCFAIGWCLMLMALPVFLIVWFVEVAK